MTTPISLDDFPRVQRAVQRVRQALDQSKGAARQILDQIKEEHNVKTADEARELVKQESETRVEVLRRYNKKLVRFKRDNADVLREIGGFTGEIE